MLYTKLYEDKFEKHIISISIPLCTYTLNKFLPKLPGEILYGTERESNSFQKTRFDL